MATYPHLTFKDTEKAFVVSHYRRGPRLDAMHLPHSINIETRFHYPDGDMYHDSVTTWNYDMNVFGIITRYTYEWYANEEDAINRFRELFLSYHTSAVSKCDMRRFIHILSTNHVVNESEPYFLAAPVDTP